MLWLNFDPSSDWGDGVLFTTAGSGVVWLPTSLWSTLGTALPANRLPFFFFFICAYSYLLWLRLIHIQPLVHSSFQFIHFAVIQIHPSIHSGIFSPLCCMDCEVCRWVRVRWWEVRRRGTETSRICRDQMINGWRDIHVIFARTFTLPLLYASFQTFTHICSRDWQTQLHQFNYNILILLSNVN